MYIMCLSNRCYIKYSLVRLTYFAGRRPLQAESIKALVWRLSLSLVYLSSRIYTQSDSPGGSIDAASVHVSARLCEGRYSRLVLWSVETRAVLMLIILHRYVPELVYPGGCIILYSVEDAV